MADPSNLRYNFVCDYRKSGTIFSLILFVFGGLFATVPIYYWIRGEPMSKGAAEAKFMPPLFLVMGLFIVGGSDPADDQLSG